MIIEDLKYRLQFRFNEFKIDILNDKGRFYNILRHIFAVCALFPMINVYFGRWHVVLGVIPSILSILFTISFFLDRENRILLNAVVDRNEEKEKQSQGVRYVLKRRSRNLRKKMVLLPNREDASILCNRKVWEIRMWAYNELTKVFFFVCNPVVFLQMWVTRLCFEGTNGGKFVFFFITLCGALMFYISFLKSEERSNDKQLIFEESTFVGNSFMDMWKESEIEAERSLKEQEYSNLEPPQNFIPQVPGTHLLTRQTSDDNEEEDDYEDDGSIRTVYEI